MSVHSDHSEIPKKQARRAGLGKALSFAALGHLGLGVAAEVAPPLVEKIERHAAQREARDTERDWHEWHQVMRRGLIERTRREIAGGHFQPLRFLLEVNRIDLSEEHREVDIVPLQKEYLRVRALFLEQRALHPDLPGVMRSLQTATQGYHYIGVGGQNIVDLLAEKTGSCEQIAEFVGSLLYETGFGDSVAFRVYPPNEDGVGHVAPTVRLTAADGRIVEWDMTSGGPAFEAGAVVPLRQIVDIYAAQHGLLEQEGVMARSAGGQLDGLRQQEDRSFEGQVHRRFVWPEPANGDTRSYPGSMPLFAGSIIHDFTTISAENRAVEEQNGEGFALDPDLVDSIFFAINHAYGSIRIPASSVSNEARNSGEVNVSIQHEKTSRTLDIISERIRSIERELKTETDPIRTLEKLGVVVALYHASRIEFAERQNTQGMAYCDKKIEAFSQMAEQYYEIFHRIATEGVYESPAFLRTQEMRVNVCSYYLSTLGAFGDKWADDVLLIYERARIAAEASGSSQDRTQITVFYTFNLFIPHSSQRAMERLKTLSIFERESIFRELHTIFMDSEDGSTFSADFEALGHRYELEYQLGNNKNQVSWEYFSSRLVQSIKQGGQTGSIILRYGTDPIVHSLNDLRSFIANFIPEQMLTGLSTSERREIEELAIYKGIEGVAQSSLSSLSQEVCARQRGLLLEMITWLQAHPSVPKAEELMRQLRQKIGQ